ncbi:MAG: diphthine synthase [Candidatus Diapherotrites archaeon]|nr:diphthine synthase [Candidatus Diapherotrites archaeon]
MLYLIGLGLWDEKDITVKGLEIAKKCDEVYLEEYTSVLKGSSKEKLEELVGKELPLLAREDLEQDTAWMDEAKEKDVALLVGGDPLVCTTHADLLMRAWEKGIETRVVHNASIFSAVAESGLQIYKFGKTATVTFWEENFRPTSFYDAVKENSARGLHTLLLLDIKGERQMTPSEAIGVLTEIDSSFGGREVVAMSRVGGDTGIVFGRAAELAEMDHGTGLHILIVPGELHVMEKAFLSHFRKD